jgi:hypothetical protein
MESGKGSELEERISPFALPRIPKLKFRGCSESGGAGIFNP